LRSASGKFKNSVVCAAVSFPSPHV